MILRAVQVSAPEQYALRRSSFLPPVPATPDDSTKLSVCALHGNRYYVTHRNVPGGQPARGALRGDGRC